MNGIQSSMIIKDGRKRSMTELSQTNLAHGHSEGPVGAGQDVKQWVYDITDWVDNSSINNLEYKDYSMARNMCHKIPWWWKGNTSQYLVGLLTQIE